MGNPQLFSSRYCRFFISSRNNIRDLFSSSDFGYVRTLSVIFTEAWRFSCLMLVLSFLSTVAIHASLSICITYFRSSEKLISLSKALEVLLGFQVQGK